MVWLFVLIPFSFMMGVVIVGSIKERYFSQGYLTGDCYDTHKNEGYEAYCRGQSNHLKFWTGGR
ncbi:hypothetical protein LCD52_14100 [Rossellomorea vietnamensis]|uniref:hypothetical protein n=1 Tax=Rossellomorea TaxID=2837508 RepID=UPI001CD00F23|nr:MULTISPECIES: hypothetical protein [Rossellomorea]MCA0149927.1 hypothetical protein [Rossellomorea vietnamensis]UTE78293.1 hypothetical protein M1J35_05870 [Rossellomorea sp. KS-H15a]